MTHLSLKTKRIVSFHSVCKGKIVCQTKFLFENTNQRITIFEISLGPKSGSMRNLRTVPKSILIYVPERTKEKNTNTFVMEFFGKILYCPSLGFRIFSCNETV